MSEWPNPETKAPLEARLKLLEQEKLKAEIARIRAQEALMRDKIDTKWYQESSFFSQLTKACFQGLATVLIGVPVLWFYVENVVKPAAEVEVLQSQKDNLEEEIQLTLTIQEVNNSLQDVQTSYAETQQKLEQANQDLGVARTSLQTVRQELESLKNRGTDAAVVNETLNSATSQIDTAEQAIGTLQQNVQAEQRDAADRLQETNELQDQLINQSDVSNGEAETPDAEAP